MAGLLLYLATLVLELPGALVRGLLAYLLAAAVVELAAGPTGLAEAAALAAGVLPLGWSLLALISPGRGWWWRQLAGGREPSARERDTLETTFEELIADRPAVRRPAAWFVVDASEPRAAVRGTTLLVSRQLLAMPHALAAVLAHELAHLNSLDGRLTEALHRLVLWELRRPAQGQGQRIGLLGFVLQGAGGGGGLRSLRGLWGGYWRRREYAADAYAADLGYGEELARFLEQHALFFDVPVPFVWLTATSHPPVELRIGRLQAGEERRPSRLK